MGMKPADRFKSVHALVLRNANQIQMALPKHISAERMTRVFFSSLRRTPKLLECSDASLVGSLMKASQLGLEPDGLLGLAYLVPRWSKKLNQHEAELQIGYLGLIELARRSGQISTIAAECVFDGDEFAYWHDETSVHFKHKPAWKENAANKIAAVWARAVLKDGGVQLVVLPRADIERFRARSQNPDGVWLSDYAAMAKKSALRQLCKLLPRSIELGDAMAIDAEAEEHRVENDELGDAIDVPVGDSSVSGLDVIAEIVGAKDDRKTVG